MIHIHGISVQSLFGKLTLSGKSSCSKEERNPFLQIVKFDYRRVKQIENKSFSSNHGSGTVEHDHLGDKPHSSYRALFFSLNHDSGYEWHSMKSYDWFMTGSWNVSWLIENYPRITWIVAHPSYTINEQGELVILLKCGFTILAKC